MTRSAEYFVVDLAQHENYEGVAILKKECFFGKEPEDANDEIQKQ
jgi:hypothetical protein